MASCRLRYGGKGASRAAPPGLKIKGETCLEIATNTYDGDTIRIFRPHGDSGIKNDACMQDGAGAHTATVIRRNNWGTLLLGGEL